ncbi:MAG: amino acid ABC transporter permease [Pusillimonas sp.]|nr:amino acid ABC transporter permease [Pusillimonas sp.]MBC41688.1 amino acid ABC transporter permease [Pusillimonas sp.]HCP79563.1 amino acid ABC transporter permease [Pusillimonas sp.]|tara:strand:- start:62672 stop:63856 length:1185 start_codon:yes stop_codon:yes gene_type:complete
MTFPANRRSFSFSRWSWRNARLRAWVYQLVMLLGIGGLAYWLVDNTLANLAARNISTGFGFLSREAGFAISESPVAYTPADSYASALWVGILNTLKVAAIGVVLATLLGSLVGIARLSGNRLLAAVSMAYIEVMRNIPLLLQLFFWYALITQSLPAPRLALEPVAGVFLSNRGLTVPWLSGVNFSFIWLVLFAALLFLTVLPRLARKWQKDSSSSGTVQLIGLACLLVISAVALFALAPNAQLSVPALQGFNFVGGATLSPEFTALLLGLVLYTAAFIAEVVRSGIQSVSTGQWQAGRALGLSEGQVLRQIILPQALRVIVPPMTSQYLNLTKNSSLAVAIGYPDIVSIANTTLNQTGQAIEGILIIMAAYLTVSLSISAVMNLYNRRIALKER